jgi:hypothetical protein
MCREHAQGARTTAMVVEIENETTQIKLNGLDLDGIAVSAKVA